MGALAPIPKKIKKSLLFYLTNKTSHVILLIHSNNNNLKQGRRYVLIHYSILILMLSNRITITGRATGSSDH